MFHLNFKGVHGAQRRLKELSPYRKEHFFRHRMHTGSSYLYENHSGFLFNFRYAVFSEISSRCYISSC